MSDTPERPRFAAALRFWLLLGCISFGGPAGQIAIMHTELVDRRRWVDEHAFTRALDVCMLLPGPEAMQLATWIGWRLHGLRGGLVAGGLFVLPASLLLAGLSWMYFAGQSIPLVGGVVFGLQAAVLGLLAAALERLGRRVLKTTTSRLVALGSLIAVAAAHVAFPWVMLAAALIGWWMGRKREVDAPPASDAPSPSIARSAGVFALLATAWLAPLAALAAWLGRDSTSAAVGSFLSRAALLTFGGAYAVLPYVAGEAVHTYGWLSTERMMAGLALAETTPGPLVLVLEYVGFAAGWSHPDLPSTTGSALLTAAVAVWATFMPSLLLVLTLAPWVDRVGRWRAAAAALSGITAAVVGVIAQLALWFGATLLSRSDVAHGVVAVVLAAGVFVGTRRGMAVYALVPACGVIGMLLDMALR
ncbi:chromate transporter [Lysobacter sp. TY2-98]|uniref:chromate efflux transporter n=1 Tax=Lysobacter sp. TY2-98 TaxID=2290922 RepID=UPI000E2014EA|nr:chromate efflux transporter [Lysobacter sp. TY2-98]AXK72358.1 chromate transporter [Lysobacter sp. TY2-98]